MPASWDPGVAVYGHFVGFEALICADDAEAIAKAKRLVDVHYIELWCGPRLVIRLNGKPASPKLI